MRRWNVFLATCIELISQGLWPCIRTEAAHIYSSAEEECIQTNAKKLWKHLSKAHGTQVFQVNVLSADDRAAKRRRKEAPSTCLEVQLKAGMEAEEGWSSVAPQVRACMEREVLQEITRLGLSQ